MDAKSNLIEWFEVPVTDMERARKFYEYVFEIEIQVHILDELEMGWFPFNEGSPGASGALVRQPDFYRPSATHGVTVYFNCADVAHTLQRVVEAGGELLQEKKEIGGGHGFMGLMLDSEGNRIALHSKS